MPYASVARKRCARQPTGRASFARSGDRHAVRITSGGCPTRFLVGTITKSAQDTLCERNFYFVRFWGLGVLGVVVLDISRCERRLLPTPDTHREASNTTQCHFL